MSIFFGLDSEYIVELHRSIFYFVTYGKGGWSHDDVYNLPIHLRRFYMKELALMIEREQKAHANAVKNNKD